MIRKISLKNIKNDFFTKPKAIIDSPIKTSKRNKIKL